MPINMTSAGHLIGGGIGGTGVKGGIVNLEKGEILGAAFVELRPNRLIQNPSAMLFGNSWTNSPQEAKQDVIQPLA